MLHPFAVSEHSSAMRCFLRNWERVRGPKHRAPNDSARLDHRRARTLYSLAAAEHEQLRPLQEQQERSKHFRRDFLEALWSPDEPHASICQQAASVLHAGAGHGDKEAMAVEAVNAQGGFVS